MGRRLTASEETQLLQDTIREGHELLKELNAKLRVARALEPGLVKEFEDIARREIEDLSNQLRRQNNDAAARLNADVAAARAEIIKQLTLMELEPVPGTDKLAFTFGAGRFDDHEPLPFPNRTDVRS